MRSSGPHARVARTSAAERERSAPCQFPIHGL